MNFIKAPNLVLLCVVGLNACAPSQPPEPPKICTIENGYEQIKKDILSQLKAPSTAIFAPISETQLFVETDTDVKCRVIGKAYVDAENSYGAKLRNNIVGEAIYWYHLKTWNVTSGIYK